MTGSAPSIRDSIASAISSSAVDTSSAPSSAPVDSSPAPEAAPSSEPIATLGAPSIAAGSDSSSPVKGARGADGKFQAKTATDPAQPVLGAAPPKTPDPAAKPEDVAEGPPILMPNGWGKEHADIWPTLPRKTQEVIEKRERERDRALHQERNKIQTSLRQLDAVNQVLQPRAQQLALGGGAPAVLGRLFALSDAAEQNPQGFIQWFAKERGIDLGSLAAGSAPAAPVDPHIKSLQDQLAQTRRALSEVGNYVRGGAQQQEAAAQGAMLKTIETWAAEPDESGSLKRPYFERLEPQILALLPIVSQEMPGASPTERLEAAYDRAVYAHPETRQAVQKMAEQKRVAEEQRKAAAAAQAARMAGTSITGSSAPNAGRVPLKSVGAELRRVVAERRGAAA